MLSVSALIRFYTVFKYGSSLTLASDDLNYIKSAAVLLEEGRLVFHQYNEPTVFIMPGYPFFLGGIFALFGTGLEGMQAVRLIQVILQVFSLYFIYRIAAYTFNMTAGIISLLLLAFYMPSITAPGFLLTESVFTFFLVLIVYVSLLYIDKPGLKKLMAIGFLTAAATLIRPTMLLYPFLFILYVIFRKGFDIKRIIKAAAVIFSVVIVFMVPWWVRNFNEYNRFIPLSAAGGNPMLQGTYINYEQTKDNTVYYKLGETALETNDIEMAVAFERIKKGFGDNAYNYIKWYTLDKTKFFWGTVFYWKEFLGVKTGIVIIHHYFLLLLGFLGFIVQLVTKNPRYMLPLIIMVYFNIIHCIYMAFDRYAYPMIPFLAISAAYLIAYSFSKIKGF